MEPFLTIRDVAGELQRWLTSDESHPGLKVSVEPGFQSLLGQQLNVVLQIPKQGIRDTLFRTYVPPTGVPVNLDFYGEEPVASGNVQEIQDRTLEFLGQPEVRDRIKMYRQLLDDADGQDD